MFTQCMENWCVSSCCLAFMEPAYAHVYGRHSMHAAVVNEQGGLHAQGSMTGPCHTLHIVYTCCCHMSWCMLQGLHAGGESCAAAELCIASWLIVLMCAVCVLNRCSVRDQASVCVVVSHILGCWSAVLCWGRHCPLFPLLGGSRECSLH